MAKPEGAVKPQELSAVRVFVLRALDRCNGQPLPGDTLWDLVALAFPQLTQPSQYADAATQHLLSHGYLAWIVRDLDAATLWVLTDKGRGAVASLKPR